MPLFDRLTERNVPTAMPWAAHIDSDLLDLYVLGKANESESEEIEKHLLICEACRESLEETGRFLSALRTVAGPRRNGRPSVHSIEEGCKAAG